MREPIYERLRRELHEREIRAEGFKQGLAEALNEKMNTMLELMRANGVSPEQIETIKAKAIEAVADMTLERRLRQ